MNIGMNETIGTVDSRPIRSAPHPHWNTITITPYEAPMLSRFISAALSGTRIDRKTSTSSPNDSSTTATISTGNRSLTRPPTSAKLAVWPPMCARAGLPPITAGKTSARSRSIVS